jgi:hypothetical protein
MTLSEEAAEIEAMRKRVRNEALEEAAVWHDEREKIFEKLLSDGRDRNLATFLLQQYENWWMAHAESADAIRALKDKP